MNLWWLRKNHVRMMATLHRMRDRAAMIMYSRYLDHLTSPDDSSLRALQKQILSAESALSDDLNSTGTWANHLVALHARNMGKLWWYNRVT